MSDKYTKRLQFNTNSETYSVFLNNIDITGAFYFQNKESVEKYADEIIYDLQDINIKVLPMLMKNGYKIIKSSPCDIQLVNETRKLSVFINLPESEIDLINKEYQDTVAESNRRDREAREQGIEPSLKDTMDSIHGLYREWFWRNNGLMTKTAQMENIVDEILFYTNTTTWENNI